MPDVYVYDTLPQALRVQIVHIIRDAFGDDSLSLQSQSLHSYATVRNALAREHGVFNLSGDATDPQADFFNFVLKADTEKTLDGVEVALGHMATRSDYYRHVTQARCTPEEAVQELNTRFREHGIGYEFVSGEIVRIDSGLLHAEAVKPALSVLTSKEFAGANEEFLTAHEHHRQGRQEEAITEALKSLESVLKVICHKRKWAYQQTDTAKTLLEICFQQGLVPAYLQSEFAALRSTLESGVPTVRNKQAGHGKGVVPRQVPDHLAAYILHLTASAIVFLARAEEALP